MERKTNLTLPSYVWVGGETAKWPNAAEGEPVAAFLCLFGMSEPPPKEKLWCASLIKHHGSTLGGKYGRSCTGRGISTRLGGTRPPNFCATALLVQSYAPKGGRPTKHTKQGAEVMVVELDAPPTPKGKPPTPSLRPSKVAKVAAQSPPPPGT